MPRRKPAALRANSETIDIGLVRAERRKVPAAPKLAGKALLAETQAAWRSFWSSDLAALVLDADRPALDRLFGLYDMRARMERAFLAEPFTTGSTGQTVLHPASKEVASLDGRIQALEDRFGLTPLGRLKLGIVLGAAARSLDDLNRMVMDDDGSGDQVEEDPRRVGVIDAG